MIRNNTLVGGNLNGGHMPDPEFAVDLESMRRNAGLSLRELVRSTGIPRSTLSDALAGRRMPRLETVLAIARACEADRDLWRRRWAAMSKQQKPVLVITAADDEAVPASGASRDASTIEPAQLPRDVLGFASREAELARLGRGGVAVIHGRPGVGKTAPAVHWAHSVSSQYPGGSYGGDGAGVGQGNRGGRGRGRLHQRLRRKRPAWTAGQARHRGRRRQVRHVRKGGGPGPARDHGPRRHDHHHVVAGRHRRGRVLGGPARLRRHRALRVVAGGGRIAGRAEAFASGHDIRQAGQSRHVAVHGEGH